MSSLPKELIREIITSGGLKISKDLLSYLKEIFKDTLQEMLEAELEMDLGYVKGDRSNKSTDNRRNEYSKKNVKSQFGDIQLDIPRDKNGDFELAIVSKNKRDISGIEDKVISLYARVMSTRDIHDQIKDIYGIEVSAEMVSKMTDSVIPYIKEWQNRPLNKVYPFVFMDAIHYKVREDGQIKKQSSLCCVRS